MGIRLDNFKSKFAYLNPWVDTFPDEIDYDIVLKNHAVLMRAYGTVLKNALNTPNKFVESHIYKRLRSLKRIYLAEIASLYDLDNTALRSTLKKSVEDIDTFQSNLFYFPISTYKGVFYIITTISVVILAAYTALSTVSVGVVDIFPWLVLLGFYFELFLVSAFFSFIDKRLLFIFPEYKPRGLFDKCKKRWKAFLGENIEGTVYEKENKLFNSLKIRKYIEPLVDGILFFSIIVVALVILAGIVEWMIMVEIFTYNLTLYLMPKIRFWSLIALSLIVIISTFLLRAKRKAI